MHTVIQSNVVGQHRATVYWHTEAPIPNAYLELDSTDLQLLGVL